MHTEQRNAQGLAGALVLWGVQQHGSQLGAGISPPVVGRLEPSPVSVYLPPFPNTSTRHCFGPLPIIMRGQEGEKQEQQAVLHMLSTAVASVERGKRKHFNSNLNLLL